MITLDYHEQTKHHFNRFARSLGYLDWASQPNPFRGYAGAPLVALYPSPAAAGAPSQITAGGTASSALNPTTLGDLLRHAFGLSAWKRFNASRWSLRVNPSSGNLHPTEAYVVCGPLEGVSRTAGVYHYAADRHALERRCAF